MDREGAIIYICGNAQKMGKEIETIEGLGRADNLHPLQKSLIAHGAVQCGFCTAGMIMAAKAMLDEDPNLSEEEVRVGLSGNVCRCTGYVKIVEAILACAEEMK
jgi:carbon-monoxide dehydrogenase small subunit